jgi:hypothetical protein
MVSRVIILVELIPKRLDLYNLLAAFIADNIEILFS